MFFGRKIRTILHEFGEKGALVLVMTAITRVTPDLSSFFFLPPPVFFLGEIAMLCFKLCNEKFGLGRRHLFP